MRCMMCEKLSLTHICKQCQETYLKPSLFKRQLSNGIEVISFYKYSEIKTLLHTKHTDIGYYIYNILAQNSFSKFSQSFTFVENLVSLPIDDSIQSGYSHTAILSKSLKSPTIKPLYNQLRAKNRDSYSGKSREYRQQHSRNFELRGFKQRNVILVDDIITTGSTLSQAVEVLHKEEKEVILCLTLCDVSIK